MLFVKQFITLKIIFRIYFNYYTFRYNSNFNHFLIDVVVIDSNNYCCDIKFAST